jgi:hypothetical protein
MATNEPIIHPPGDMWACDKEKPKNSEKNLSHCDFVHCKSYMD